MEVLHFSVEETKLTLGSVVAASVEGIKQEENRKTRRNKSCHSLSDRGLDGLKE